MGALEPRNVMFKSLGCVRGFECVESIFLLKITLLYSCWAKYLQCCSVLQEPASWLGCSHIETGSPKKELRSRGEEYSLPLASGLPPAATSPAEGRPSTASAAQKRGFRPEARKAATKFCSFALKDSGAGIAPEGRHIGWFGRFSLSSGGLHGPSLRSRI